MVDQANLEELIELAKRRGFFWPSFSIYGGFSGFNDYGPLGSILKDRVYDQWKRVFFSVGALEVDTPNLTPEVVLKASGHVEKFLDLAVECDMCKNRFKLENILEASGSEKIPESVESANEILTSGNFKCPKCGNPLKRAFEFYLMFKVVNGSETFFLRPETAQGIFPNFKLLLNQNRGKLPMIVIQQGKGFRNEISPRQGIIRQREFNMAEAEVFLPEEQVSVFTPEGDEEVTLLTKEGKLLKMNLKEAAERKIILTQDHSFFMELIFRFAVGIGISRERLRFRQHRNDELAHYSSECWDLEFQIDKEWMEITGIADRGKYDLSKHITESGENLFYEENKIAHVLEPSSGIDRVIASLLLSSLKKRETGYNLLKLPGHISPYRVAVLPLQKKDGLSEKALEIFSRLRKIEPYSVYDESGAIGRRYARQDEIGTPYCITIDYETLERNVVTIRERDGDTQIKEISVEELFSSKHFLTNEVLKKFKIN